jgi:hypothetical protein
LCHTVNMVAMLGCVSVSVVVCWRIYFLQHLGVLESVYDSLKTNIGKLGVLILNI